MSHVTNGDLCIKNLDDAAAAAEALGGVLIRDKKTFVWYGEFLNDWDDERAAVNRGFDPKTFGKCDHVIALKGAEVGDYEIGLVKRADGEGFDAVYDSWGVHGRRLESTFGVGLGMLKREVGVLTAMRKARLLGYNVRRSLNERNEHQVEVW